MRAKSVGASGNRLAIPSGGRLPQIIPANELSPRKSAIDTTNTPASDFFDTLRMSDTSAPAPMAKPVTMPSRTARTSGTPHESYCHVRKVQNMAISPCAKLR